MSTKNEIKTSIINKLKDDMYEDFNEFKQNIIDNVIEASEFEANEVADTLQGITSQHNLIWFAFNGEASNEIEEEIIKQCRSYIRDYLQEDEGSMYNIKQIVNEELGLDESAFSTYQYYNILFE